MRSVRLPQYSVHDDGGRVIRGPWRDERRAMAFAQKWAFDHGARAVVRDHIGQYVVSYRGFPNPPHGDSMDEETLTLLERVARERREEGRIVTLDAGEALLLVTELRRLRAEVARHRERDLAAQEAEDTEAMQADREACRMFDRQRWERHEL